LRNSIDHDNAAGLRARLSLHVDFSGGDIETDGHRIPGDGKIYEIIGGAVDDGEAAVASGVSAVSDINLVGSGIHGDGNGINGVGILNGSFISWEEAAAALNGVDFCARAGDEDGVGLRIYGE